MFRHMQFAKELSFSNGHLEEVFYSVSNPDLPIELRGVLEQMRTTYFPGITADRVQAFSYQRPDGDVYTTSKFMLMVDNARKDCFLYPDLFCFNPWMHYCLNSATDPMGTFQPPTAKFYALDLADTVTMKLPPSARFAKAYGVGISPGMPYRGIYLTTTNYDELIEFFGLPDPMPAYIDRKCILSKKEYLFGLTYHPVTNKPIRLVYYVYTSDDDERRHATDTAIKIE